MPRPLNHDPGPFAKRLREARQNAGMPLDVASVYVRELLGSDWGLSRETLRRYEDGTTTEDRADPLVVAALADLYGVPLEWLSASVADRMEHIHSLTTRVLGLTNLPWLRSRRGKPNTP